MFGFATLLLGTMIYNKYLKEREYRDLMKWSFYIGFVGALTGLIFAMRWNVAVGINDLVFIIFTGIVTDTLSMSLRVMP